jgi:Flp pilus assembly protein TadD
MKTGRIGKKALSMIVSVIGAAVLAGCGKNSSTPATEQLQKSYDKADAAIKQEIVQANAAFQSGDYARALQVMDKVVQSHPVDEAQKQAVDALIIQTREAVKLNPKLNTPELYKATADLMLRAHGEN